MVFKKIFGGGSEKLPKELDIDDLIVLERYAEAEERLRTKLKANENDLHSHVKLAEVFTATGQVSAAVREYLYAADEYADDGFYDKAIALLAKAAKLDPADTTIAGRGERFEEVKRVEQSRAMALEGLMTARRESGERPSMLEAQQIWLDLQATPLMKNLNADQLRRLFGAVAILKPAPGAPLVEQDSSEQKLFIVSRGGVEAIWQGISGGSPRRTTLRTFGPGDVFGESTLFERQPWRFTCYADSLCVLLALDKTGLELALQGNSDPKTLLDVLRGARSDRELGSAIAMLEA